MTERKPRTIIIANWSQRAEALHDAVTAYGYPAEVVNLYQGEQLPNVENVDAIISSGGPMGVYEMDRPEYDFLAREADFLKDAVDRGKAVLGVCLGHQLLGHVLGGEVVRDEPSAEIGWSKITLTPEGASDELFQGLEREFTSFQYHFDRVVNLPQGTLKLAFSDREPLQAFHYSSQPIWGVQFHPEINPDGAREILLARAETVKKYGVDAFLMVQEGERLGSSNPARVVFYNFLGLLN